MTDDRPEADKTIDRLIGLRIRQTRDEQDLPCARLAEAARLTSVELADIEKGDLRASAERLKLLADALGVEVSVFYEG